VKNIPLDNILEESGFLTDKISTLVRTVAVSEIAFVWALLTAGSADATVFSMNSAAPLIIAGVVAIAALTCDFLQYFFGFLYVNALRTELEEANLEEGLYDYGDWRYRTRNALFWIKQIVLFVSLAFLVYAVATGV